jgi:hypothetical protein
MSARTRSLLLLGGTLLLGALLGALVASALQARRTAAVGGLLREGRLPTLLHEAIGPLPPERDAEVRRQLEILGRTIQQRMLSHRREMHAFVDSLLEELRPELDEAQWQALRGRLGQLERRFERPPGAFPGPGRGQGRGPGRGSGGGPRRPPPDDR